MVVVFKQSATDEQITSVIGKIEHYGFRIHKSVGERKILIGAIGDSPNFDVRKIKVLDGVADAIKITEPYKLASRCLKSSNTVIDLGTVKIGSDQLVLISGPCSIENEDQIYRLAEVTAQSGAKILRGGAFKPRSSPYSFQGMGKKGLEIMRKAADKFGLKIITEIIQHDHVDLVYEYADIFQVGARNMQNFPLLKELGKTDKPVMLKRGISATVEEWLMSAEYLLAGGNEKVFLCERGIRTYERFTRHTFDLSSIPVIQEKSHLPVIADPSHASGYRHLVPPMARAAIAAGADGIMIEIHNNPEEALSDGPQAMFPENFLKLVEELKAIAEITGRSF